MAELKDLILAKAKNPATYIIDFKIHPFLQKRFLFIKTIEILNRQYGQKSFNGAPHLSLI